jgi:hypothetical protein
MKLAHALVVKKKNHLRKPCCQLQTAGGVSTLHTVNCRGQFDQLQVDCFCANCGLRYSKNPLEQHDKHSAGKVHVSGHKEFLFDGSA